MSEDSRNNRDIRDANNEVEAKLLNNESTKFVNKNTDYLEKNGEETKVIAIDSLMRDMPLTDDITCGFWIFKRKFLQRFANQTTYVCLYGIVGCIFSMTFAYSTGTITTIEKRFKIPSKNIGIISIGNDISQLFAAAGLCYYAGKGHRPRWLGFGVLTIVIFCFLTALPHFLYGAGEDALSLTKEFGAILDENATHEAVEAQRSKELCRDRGDGSECEMSEGNLAPQVIFFLAQFISGIGGSLYFTLGVAYMDDNTKKSKTPALLSVSFFLRMLGPALGYSLASFCLRKYIAPHLHPVIGKDDPRWLGAWWMGWLLLGVLLAVCGFFLTMFPKQLPRAMARRIVESKRNKGHKEDETEPKASLKDLLNTFKSMICNPTLMCNNLSTVFYLFGYTPFWMFNTKYIEIQYRQTAATSSFVIATTSLGFSSLGVLLSGFLISKYKPRARYMAAWNVIVGFLTVAAVLSFAAIGCPGNENSVVVNIHDSSSEQSPSCNSDCYCDYVTYSPICGEDGRTYISPCHAGCRHAGVASNGHKTYYSCGCIPGNDSTKSSTAFDWITTPNSRSHEEFLKDTLTPSVTTSATNNPDIFFGGQAIQGACPVADCFNYFAAYLAVMSCMQLLSASGRATNFFVSVRCVPEKDKTVAMGFDIMLMSLFAFIPSPIFFGWVIDNLCLVWGKTCTTKGNCWLYNAESLRYTLNVAASIFMIIGTIFDVGVWYCVKDLKIFDEEEKAVELNILHRGVKATSEKNRNIIQNSNSNFEDGGRRRGGTSA